MRFAVVALACVLAVANAQQFGRYNNFGYNNGQYNANGQYKSNGQYQGYLGQYQQNQYNRYQPYNRYNNQGYRPFVTSTPFPPKPSVAKATASVSVSPAPAVSVAPVVSAAPVVSVAPVAPVVNVAPVPLTVAKALTNDGAAETVRFGNEINPDGSYNYFYETNNGIAAQAQGTPRNLGGNPPVVPDVVQGSFSWISPEGKTVSVTYVADENGYQPQSDDLPVPPPLPAQIARALEYVARTAKN